MLNSVSAKFDTIIFSIITFATLLLSSRASYYTLRPLGAFVQSPPRFFRRTHSVPAKTRSFSRPSSILLAGTSSRISTRNMSLEEFLHSHKVNPSNHFVVGNAAGDADSIISALALAYIESSYGSTVKTPIVSISRKDLETQRPEVLFLFQTLGFHDINDNLLFVDDDAVIISSQKDRDSKQEITLVDHNHIDQDVFANRKVVEILDHHYDEKQHKDNCFGDKRRIAYQDDKALVASTCTLVAERLKELKKPLYHPTLSALLLSVILLDSVNMIPTAEKGTPRDGSAIEDLLENTDWSAISSQQAINKWWPPSFSDGQSPLDPASKPDTTRIFESLQGAKFDPAFWDSLSVQDALRLDYKHFSVQKDRNFDIDTIGVSSILMPMTDFLSKPDLVQEAYKFMKDIASVDLLAVMFFFSDRATGENHRQFMLCGTREKAEGLVGKISKYLLEGDDCQTLGLEETNTDLCSGNEKLILRLFEQGNVKASRKQVAPLLIKFFESQ